MFCKKCGAPLKDGAAFCQQCGTPTAKTSKETVTASAADTAPEKKPQEQTTAKTQAKQGFFASLWEGMKELFKHPKKLIPTFVLAAVWIILPLIMGFVSGANIPIIRFLSTLTYANGGVFGGFFGTVGGIFGKAVFAAAVNGFVLALCEKKNPFAGLKKSTVGVIGGGSRAISPFLIGGGIGFLLYFFFNITSAPQNSMISIVCVITLIQTIAKQNGIVFALAFWAVKKVSKGKAPTRMYLNRILSGLAAAFAISFPVTFLRVRFLTPLLGILLLAAGIALPMIFAAAEKKLAQKNPM